jgi:ABC-type glycerol-3-phosphate transport system substrate-binding protein
MLDTVRLDAAARSSQLPQLGPLPVGEGGRMPGEVSGAATRRRVLRGTMAGAAGGLATLLAACAGPGSGGAGQAQGQSQSTGTAPATIRYTDDNSEPSRAFGVEIAKRIAQKHPNITAVHEVFSGSSWKERSEKYTAMAIAGEMPEIVWFSATFLRPALMKGFVRELDSYIKKDWKQSDIDDFYKGPWEGMKIDGKQMAVPVTINNNIMYVNLNHLREAALPYPGDSWTREQFLDYTQKLLKRGGGGVERWAYDMPFDNLDRNVSWILMNGGEPHDTKDGPQVTKLTYDTQRAIDGLQFIHDLRWKHQVSPITADQRAGLGMEDAFIQGKTSIFMVATNNAANIAAKAPASGLEWDFLTLPRGAGGQGARVSMDGWVIDKASKVADQAWTVLREISSAETTQLFAEVRRFTSPRRSGHQHWEKAYGGKTARVGRPLAESARADPRAFWKDSDMVGGIMEKHVQATMNRNEVGVAEAMRQAMSEVRGYYGSGR